MIKMLKVECLTPIDLGERAGNFKKGEKYLARFSRKNNLVVKTGNGVWINFDEYGVEPDLINELFYCYGEFHVESYHQV